MNTNLKNYMLENELSKELFNSNILKRELRSKFKQIYKSNVEKFKCKNLGSKILKEPLIQMKLRISAHKLHFETGRYKKYDKDLEKYTNIPKCERRCQTCLNEVENECQFLFKCQRSLGLRREFLNQWN